MSACGLVSLIFFITFSTCCYNCIRVIPERAAIQYVDEKYFGNATVNVRRSSKRGEYVLNIEGNTKKPLGNNVTLHIAFFEYRSTYRYNQYVRTFMEFHYKLCEFIFYDKIIGFSFRKSGLSQCPIPVGFVSMRNVTFNGHFPFDIDFEKGKVVVILSLEPQEERLGSIEIFVNFRRS